MNVTERKRDKRREKEQVDKYKDRWRETRYSFLFIDTYYSLSKAKELLTDIGWRTTELYWPFHFSCT